MIRIQHSHLHVMALSHPGMSGKNNEDRYAITSYQLGETERAPCVLAVVADGIGGHRAGEVAAEMAVNYITQETAKGDAHQPLEVLETAIHTASDAIFAKAAQSTELHGMGATCACAWVIADRLFTASVGDSRIYLLRGGKLQQITVDHTWVQEATDRGLLSPEQAREHPNVHVIRRYLGSPTPPEVDFRIRLQASETDAHANANQGMVLRPNDTLLLCSDGLTDLVWNDEIQAIILASADLPAAAQKLVDLANQRGGHDNITILLLRMPENAKPVPTKSHKRYTLPWIVGIISGALVFLAGLAMLGWYLLHPNGQVTQTPKPVTEPTVTNPAPTIPAPTITPTSTLTPSPTFSPINTP